MKRRKVLKKIQSGFSKNLLYSKNFIISVFNVDPFSLRNNKIGNDSLDGHTSDKESEGSPREGFFYCPLQRLTHLH